MTLPASPPPFFRHQQSLFDETKDEVAWAVLFEQGCVDGETEYLSPIGWRRIDSYQGGLVTQWSPFGERAEFVQPACYIDEPCDRMLHIACQRGTDQMLSLDHRVPFIKRDTYGAFGGTVLARDLFATDMWRLPSKYHMAWPGEGVTLSDEALRVQIAVMADGSFPKRNRETNTTCNVRLKKQRKIDRLNELLRSAKIEANIRPCKPEGFIKFTLKAPLRLKSFPIEWWTTLSDHQVDVILDEIFFWDGTQDAKGRRRYFSRHESDVDFVQHMLGSRGRIARKQFGGGVWFVAERGVRTGDFWIRRKDLRKVPAPNGRMYCFTVPSGFLLLRRRGQIFPTGNCGKTAPTIRTAEHLYRENRIDGVIVVAPNGVHRNWTTDELPKHAGVAWRGLDWHSDRGKGQDRALERLLAIEPSNAAHGTTGGRRIQELAWLAITYEGIVTPRGRAAVLAFKERYPRLMLVIDEGSKVRNPEAMRTKKVAALRGFASHVRLLNGTPIGNSALDIYSQMKLLDPMFWIRHGIGSWTSFKSRFAVMKKIVVGGEDEREVGERRGRWEPIVPHGSDRDMVDAYEQLDLDGILSETEKKTVMRPTAPTGKATTGRTIEVVVGFRELDKLKEMIAPLSTRVTKEDAGLDLPPKLYSRLMFDLPPEQRRVYDTLRKEFMVELDNGSLITAPLALVRIMRLQQIASGFLPNPDDPENPKLFYDDDGKNPRLKLLLERLEDTPHQAIVWGRFTRSVDAICRALGPPKCVRYDGEVSQRDRDAGIDRFKSGKAKFVVAKAQSMGMGLTLVGAKSVFYYENTFSYIDRLQSEDRAHRIGQTSPVMYYDMVAYKTVDEKILRSLRDCADVANEVTGDRYRSWLEES